MNLTCDDNWHGVHSKRVYKVNDGQEMVLACDVEFASRCLDGRALFHLF